MRETLRASTAEIIVTLILSLTTSVCLAQQGPHPVSVRNVKPEKVRDRQLERAILRSVEALQDARAPTFYTYDRVDLDGDGVPETIVHVDGRDVCGTGGCSTLIFRKREGDYKLISDIALTRTPIAVSPIRSHGWRDLIVLVVGGGIQPGYYAVLSFDGSSYPENPSVPPAQPLIHNVASTAYLAGTNTRGFQLTSSQ